MEAEDDQNPNARFFPAPARSKADMFVLGGWAGGVNATSFYTLDIAAAAPVRDFKFQSLQQ